MTDRFSVRFLVLLAASFAVGCEPAGPHYGSGQRYTKVRNQGYIYYGGAGQTPGGPGLPADTFTPSTGIANGVGGGNAQAANMPTPLRDHTATLLDNGDVLIGGGVAGGFVTDEAMLYRESKGEFSKLKNTMKTKRALHTATRLGAGNVIIIGGVDNQGLPMSSVEQYNPNTGEFERLSDLPTKRAGHTATALATGEILVVGGAVEIITTRQPAAGTGGQLTGWKFTNDADLFRPSAQQGRHFNAQNNSVGGTPAKMQNMRAFHQAVLLPKGPAGGDRVLILSGLQGLPNLPATGVNTGAELYDLSSNTWTNVAVSGMTARWCGHALPVNFRADTTKPNPKVGDLWDVMVIGGLNSLFVGQQILSFLPSGSNRETGEGATNDVQIIRIETQPSVQGRVIAEDALQTQQRTYPPIGAGSAFVYLPRLGTNTSLPTQHLLDRYFYAGGVCTHPQVGPVFFDTGAIITVDTSKIPDPLPAQLPLQTAQTPQAGIINFAQAGQGALPSPNKFNSTTKYQSFRAFHAAVRMRGKDGQEATADDTVLSSGGKIDPVSATATADVYAAPDKP